jgi:N,N-dimethylformamidase beta subunit-like protein
MEVAFDGSMPTYLWPTSSWSRARPLLLALVGLVLLVRPATAAGILEWQLWGGSAATKNLTIAPGPVDVTGDGKLDVVALHAESGKIWIGRTTADGGHFDFCMEVNANCPSGLVHPWAQLASSDGARYQLHTGDFLGDTRPDLVVYDATTGKVTVLKNDGDHFVEPSSGEWSPTTVDPVDGWTLIAGHFSGGARSDALVYHWRDGSIFVGRSDGTRFTWTAWSYLDPAGGPDERWVVVPGEFTGDNRTDVLAYAPRSFSPPYTNVRVGRSLGTGFTFENRLDLDGFGWRPVPGRFTGTTVDDLGVYSHPGSTAIGGFQVFRNAEDTFLKDKRQWAAVDPGNALWALSAGDFTSDGRVDLFAYYPLDGTLYVGKNLGAPPEGHAWPLSAKPSEYIDFFWSGDLETGNNVVISRYHADGSGRIVPDPSFVPVEMWLPSTRQRLHASPGRNGTGWSSTLHFPIPNTPQWTPGIYALELRGSAPDSDFEITFVVKPADSERKRVAVIANVNTWNAYNDWGGTGKYQGFGHAALTSLLRPNPAAALTAAGDFGQYHLAYAELWIWTVVNDLLQGGVDVYTDLDFDSDPCFATNTTPRCYDKIILSTHPEYWSATMYDRLDHFIDDGGSLLYLGGNGLFESMTYSPDHKQITYLDGHEDGSRLVAVFRNRNQDASHRPARGERYLLGVGTQSCGQIHHCDHSYTPDLTCDPSSPDGQPYVAIDRTHPIFAGVSLPSNDEFGAHGLLDDVDRNGTVFLAGASGHETDRKAAIRPDGLVVQPGTCDKPGEEISTILEGDTTPDNVAVLAEGKHGGAHMTFYRAKRWNEDRTALIDKGFVFSVGSINFGQSLFIDPVLRKIVDNVLHMN